jgi:hypothetical protein
VSARRVERDHHMTLYEADDISLMELQALILAGETMESDDGDEAARQFSALRSEKFLDEVGFNP